MNSRFFILCLLAALSQFHCHAADTNVIVTIGPGGFDDTRFNQPTGRNTNLLATGQWIQPASDGHGNKLRGRLVVYESDIYTNESGQVGWKCPLVSLEIQDLAGSNKPPTRIYLNVNGLRFDLRDANGAPADNLGKPGGGSYFSYPAFWATVPMDGILRLHAAGNIVATSLGLGARVPKEGDLYLAFHSRQTWLIPEEDHNLYFLSVTIPPRRPIPALRIRQSRRDQARPTRHRPIPPRSIRTSGKEPLSSPPSRCSTGNCGPATVFNRCLNSRLVFRRQTADAGLNEAVGPLNPVL
jgi:hypothetical protein